MRRGVGWALAGAAAALAAAATCVLVRAGPDYALAGTTLTGAVLELAAAAVLAVAGLLVAGMGDSRAAALLLAAAICFLAEEWATPVVAGALPFGAGLLAAGLVTPLAADAALGCTGAVGRPVSALLALTYAGTMLAGPVAALALTPDRHGCADCPPNPFAVLDAPGLVTRLERAGGAATAAAASALVGAALWRLYRGRAAARAADTPLLSALVLVLVAGATVALVHVHDPAGVNAGARGLQSVALLALGLAFVWRRVLRALRRTALVRVVARIAAAPAPGRLRDALATLVGDEGLRLVYPLEAWEHVVDTDGHEVEPAPEGADVTRLTRDGRPLALLVHRHGLLEEPSLAREVVSTAGLVVEHERLRAAERARLRDLRASRIRLVSVADAERRRLERDLHDGAQQRLVGLAMKLGHATARDAPAAAQPHLLIAAKALEEAIAALRTLARGIFPPALAAEGLAAALEDLAYAAPVRVRLGALPPGRTQTVVEATAYLVAAVAVRHADLTGIALDTEALPQALRLVAQPSRPPAGELVEVAERVAALDGRLCTDAGRVEMLLPCAW